MTPESTQRVRYWHGISPPVTVVSKEGSRNDLMYTSLWGYEVDSVFRVAFQAHIFDVTETSITINLCAASAIGSHRPSIYSRFYEGRASQ